ncbi:hypothetical protein CG51_09020 [Haematobacter missouriensis]|nr:hypothetical protein CG51_09020 [Haematobacter missouriensis]
MSARRAPRSFFFCGRANEAIGTGWTRRRSGISMPAPRSGSPSRNMRKDRRGTCASARMCWRVTARKASSPRATGRRPVPPARGHWPAAPSAPASLSQGSSSRLPDSISAARRLSGETFDLHRNANVSKSSQNSRHLGSFQT